MKNETEEQISKMSIAKARVLVYAELVKVHLWMINDHLPPARLKEFSHEFVDPANKLAQEALDSWIEIAPEK